MPATVRVSEIVDALEIAKRIVSTGLFLSRPSKFEGGHERKIRDFAQTVERDRIREDLLRATLLGAMLVYAQAPPSVENASGLRLIVATETGNQRLP